LAVNAATRSLPLEGQTGRKAKAVTRHRRIFEVALRDCTTQGAILCQQVRTIDCVARGVKYIEKAPTVVIDEVLAKVGLLVK
jgi:mRNA-degrading endonuclease toxin of MazEF toxin-antitoxin module